MRLSIAIAVCLIVLPCCEPEPARGVGYRSPSVSPRDQQARLHHDFGVIRHGKTSQHEFVVPIPETELELIPLLFRANCSCVHARLVVVGPDGVERFPDGNPFEEYAIREGDELRMRLELDTTTKEAADLPPVLETGSIILQSAKPPYDRTNIPVSFRFGIETPIEVRPAATINLGRMPRSIKFSQTHALRPTVGEVEFGLIRCVERDSANPQQERNVPDVGVEFDLVGDEARLRLTFQPAPERPLGPFAFRIEIETDIDDGYRLVLPVSGIVVADIEVAPPGKIGFGQIDVTEPQSQFVIVTDHDVRRPVEFYVKGIVDRHGSDVSHHFGARLESVDAPPRSQMLILDYAGTLDVNSFRGEVLLSKTPDGPTAIAVEFVGYRRR